MKQKQCPECDAPALRAWYYGIPMWLCEDEDCSHVWGFWTWIFHILPFDGYFQIKE